MSASPPTAAGVSTADALWSFLWGKRRSRRHPVALPAHVRSAGGAAAAEALNLSRHGVLLRVVAGEVAALEAEPGTSGLLGAAHLLGEGFDLAFAAGVDVRARLVRLCWRPGDEEHVYLGCEFSEPLGARGLAALGLSRRDCTTETGVGTPPAARMAWVAEAEEALSVVVFDLPKKPLYVGPLVGVEGAALAVHLDPADPTSVVARLSGKPHSVSVVLRGAEPWTTQAFLLAVRLLEGRTDAVEVVLAASQPPPRAVLRHLRKGRAARAPRR